MAYLVLFRHGQSEANAQPGMHTGTLDVPITEEGKQQVRDTAILLASYQIDLAIRTPLLRTGETLDIIKEVLSIDPDILMSPELIERNWGEVQGMPKADIDAIYTEETQAAWMTWDEAPPRGESYEDVLKRIQPYYQETILPLLLENKNILIVGHAAVFKVMRAFLEHVPKEALQSLQLSNGEIYMYDIDPNGSVISVKYFPTDE